MHEGNNEPCASNAAVSGKRTGHVSNAGLAAERSGWSEFEAAHQAREALSRLSDLSPSSVVVLTLRRLEVLELVHACMKRHAVDYSGAHLTAQDWTRAEAIDEIRSLRSRLSDEHRASLDASLAERGQSFLSQLDAKNRRRAAQVLGRTADELRTPFYREQLQVERRRFWRWVGIGAALLAVFVLCVLGARWVEAYRQRDNLAFHRPVQASSTEEVAYLNTDRLVDGVVDNVGFHTTAADPSPSATIDLGASKRFGTVVIHNRADCCQERQVPMVLEVSEDGVKFERLAERAVKFDAWTVDNLQARGRYVRLRLEGSGMFHLAEVAIYP